MMVCVDAMCCDRNWDGVERVYCGELFNKLQWMSVVCGSELSDLPQMIASHEFLRANGTREILFFGMDACMTGQFIGTGKSFATIVPCAHVRFLACK